MRCAMQKTILPESEKQRAKTKTSENWWTVESIGNSFPELGSLRPSWKIGLCLLVGGFSPTQLKNMRNKSNWIMKPQFSGWNEKVIEKNT